jgi:hypothetical protein
VIIDKSKTEHKFLITRYSFPAVSSNLNWATGVYPRKLVWSARVSGLPGGTAWILSAFTESKQKLGTFCCVREFSTYEENLARLGGQNICLILSHLRSYESGPAPAVAVLLSKFW